MTKLIPLTQGHHAIVDDVDYEWLSLFKWCYQPAKNGKTGYAIRTNPTTRMHRLIVNAPIGVMADHHDGNGLNNTRANIRIATRIQNCQNQSGHSSRVGKYKGVYFYNGKHRARISVNKKEIYIGGYDIPEDAARAYDQAAILHFGEFARLNFSTDEGATS